VRLVPSFLVLALGLSSFTGCAIVRDDADALLARGRVVEALEELESAEKESVALPRPARARYALRRGLVHLALGDPFRTDRWLSEAKAHYDADPRCLSPEDAGKLLDAWASLGRGL
jgi:hypothetical protein